MVDNFLFERFKDTRAFATNWRREKIQLKFPKANIPKIHKMIVDYQIKKYGQSLGK